ncbi:MAG: hypothetical protein ACPGRX_07590 [Bdellovibrionales bacterium]
MTVQAITKKTLEYLRIPAVVGHEHGFMRYVRRDLRTLGLRTELRKGVLAVHGKNPFSQIVCAHIDRHGLISIGGAQYAYAAQYVKEIKYGEENKSSRRELQNIAARFEGERVYAYDPMTLHSLGEGGIETCEPCMDGGDSLFYVHDIEIDELGIPLAYARQGSFENGYLKGQIDNAVCVATLRVLLENGFEGTALFTTEEEIGKSWTHIARYLRLYEVETDRLIVLDTSPYTDKAPIEQGYVIFRNRDFSEIFNPVLVHALKNRCENLGLPYQVKDEYLLAKGKTVEQLGSTELGRLIQNEKDAGGNPRWNGATIQIPTMMYHTSYETASEIAINNFYTFLKDILIDNPIG